MHMYLYLKKLFLKATVDISLNVLRVSEVLSGSEGFERRHKPKPDTRLLYAPKGEDATATEESARDAPTNILLFVISEHPLM